MDELGIPPLDNSVDEVQKCNDSSLNLSYVSRDYWMRITFR